MSCSFQLYRIRDNSVRNDANCLFFGANSMMDANDIKGERNPAVDMSAILIWKFCIQN